MREPGGTLDASDGIYEALDERRVRVSGSRFEPADQYTVKLEGAAIAGYQTLAIAGVRDPAILGQIEAWRGPVVSVLNDGVSSVLGLSATHYSLDPRCYRGNAVLRESDKDAPPPREGGADLV